MKTILRTSAVAADTGAPAEPTTPADIAGLEGIRGLSHFIDPVAVMKGGTATSDYRVRDRAAPGRLYYKPTPLQTELPDLGFVDTGNNKGPYLQFGFGGSKTFQANLSGTLATPTDATVIPTGDFTLCFAIRVATGADVNRDIMGGADRSGASGFWRIYTNSSGYLIYAAGGSPTVFQNNVDLRDDAWRMVTITHSPNTGTADSGTAKMYIDGTLVDTDASADDIDDVARNRALCIGGSMSADNSTSGVTPHRLGRLMIINGRLLDSGGTEDAADIAIINQHYKDEYGIAVAGTT